MAKDKKTLYVDRDQINHITGKYGRVMSLLNNGIEKFNENGSVKILTVSDFADFIADPNNYYKTRFLATIDDTMIGGLKVSKEQVYDTLVTKPDLSESLKMVNDAITLAKNTGVSISNLKFFKGRLSLNEDFQFSLEMNASVLSNDDDEIEYWESVEGMIKAINAYKAAQGKLFGENTFYPQSDVINFLLIDGNRVSLNYGVLQYNLNERRHQKHLADIRKKEKEREAEEKKRKEKEAQSEEVQGEAAN